METIVPIGSPMSAFSLVGILYILFCLLGIFMLKTKGWFSVLSLAFCGAIWVGASQPNIIQGPVDDGSDGYYPFVYIDGKWCNEQDLYLTTKYSIDWLYYKPWKDQRRYKMHVVGGISPRFYHPDALYWSPVIACGIGLLLSPIWIIYITSGLIIGCSYRDK